MTKTTDKEVRDYKAKFAAAHEKRYGKRVLKTAWHFLHWASEYYGDTASRRFFRFERWCVRNGQPRTADNAVRWFLTCGR